MQRDKHRSDRRHRNADEAAPATPGRILATAAERECRRISRALADTRHRHHGIHRARKSIRMLRALLDLLEPALGTTDRERIRRIDKRLKRVCRGLASLRDAHVAAAMASGLGHVAAPAERSALEAALVSRRDDLTQEALRRDPALRSRREAIEAIRTEIADLPWALLRVRKARQAIQRSCHRVKRAKRKAHHTPTAPMRHRWRRRLRRLRLQLQALEAVTGPADANAPGGPCAPHALKHQTDRLGQLQDVLLMCRLARRIAAVRDDPRLRAALAAALHAARTEFANAHEPARAPR